MERHVCKYCGIRTNYKDKMCRTCREKVELIHKIKAMLMPYYERKKKNGN